MRLRLELDQGFKARKYDQELEKHLQVYNTQKWVQEVAEGHHTCPIWLPLGADGQASADMDSLSYNYLQKLRPKYLFYFLVMLMLSDRGRSL